MVVRGHPSLSLSRQCRLLSIGRSSLYYKAKGESAETLALMRRIIVHAASIGRFLRKLGYTYKKIVDRNRALSYSGDASASGLVPAPHPGHAGAASSSCVH